MTSSPGRLRRVPGARQLRRLVAGQLWDVIGSSRTSSATTSARRTRTATARRSTVLQRRGAAATAGPYVRSRRRNDHELLPPPRRGATPTSTSAFTTGASPSRCFRRSTAAQLHRDLFGGGGGPPAATRFYTVPPCRVVDTRSHERAFGGPALGPPKRTADFVPSGRCGIPSEGEGRVGERDGGPGGRTAGNLPALPGRTSLRGRRLGDQLRAGQTRANNVIGALSARAELTGEM